MDEAGSNNTSSTANIVAVLWLASLVIIGFVGFMVGKSSTVSTSPEVAGITTVPTGGPQLSTPPNANIVDLDTSCKITGPAQKKDYLVPYILKEGDSFQSIAENELNDQTRVTELTNLNDDAKNLTVGSTIYLPPSEIKSSSGHLVQVSGKIVKKDNGSWQLTYGGGKDGPGIWIPAYYLKDLSGLEQFKVGDCVTLLIDNGVRAYSIKKTE